MPKWNKVVIAVAAAAAALLAAILYFRPPCAALQDVKMCATFRRSCNWGSQKIDCGSVAGDRCDNMCYEKRGNPNGSFAVWSDSPSTAFIKLFTGEPLR
ncbi:MAG TPA: hypothetical protein VL500_00730 [Candidatus Eisenbacteria bacterium]|jgi:hypothetical protein|nr:hypothetical protein [Candidatus Eisenbacteria bacterium]